MIIRAFANVVEGSEGSGNYCSYYGKAPPPLVVVGFQSIWTAKCDRNYHALGKPAQGPPFYRVFSRSKLSFHQIKF